MSFTFWHDRYVNVMHSSRRYSRGEVAMHLGTFPGKHARSAAEPAAHGDTLTSIIFAVIVMYTIMAAGFAQVLQ
jgi:hypothetical protein